MSYHIYTTEGIILKRVPFGEADLLLYILTEDMGLIIASARSVRVSASKLRPALQEYTNITVSCIKGKNGWKVTNVAQIQNFYFDFPEHSHKVLARVVSLLIKMMPGESNHPAVFSIVKKAFVTLKDLEKENVENLETLLVFRIMYELGYVARNPETESFLTDLGDWGRDLVQFVSSKRKILVEMINNGLKESQL